MFFTFIFSCADDNLINNEKSGNEIVHYDVEKNSNILDQYTYSFSKLEFYDLKGNKYVFGERYKNQRVIVLVCAYYCGPCIRDLKILNEINKKNKHNLLILTSSDLDKMHKVAKANGIDSLEFYSDRYKDILRSLSQRVIPFILFINEDHILLDTMQGIKNINNPKLKFYLDVFDKSIAISANSENTDEEC